MTRLGVDLAEIKLTVTLILSVPLILSVLYTFGNLSMMVSEEDSSISDTVDPFLCTV